MSIFGNTGGTNSLFKTASSAPNLFASGSQQPAAAGTGIFGQQTQPAASTTAGTSNIFGQPQQQPTASTTNVFGQPQQAAGTTNIFGQPAPGATSTNIFGQPSQPAAATGTNIFGQSVQPAATATSTNIFGQPTQPAAGTGNNLFGQPQATTGTNLFGIQAQQPATTGGGIFGGQQQPSLFGASTANQPSTGLFGNQQQAQPAQSSNLFGSTNPTASLFGKPATTGTNLFGSTSAQPQQGTSGLFQTAQPQPQKNAFGTSSLFPSSSALGQSTLSASSLLPSQRVGQPQVDAQVQFARLQDKIETIVHAWNPASPMCRFQRCFYNLVDPRQVSLYGRPPNATNDALWQKAVRENPDPSCLVPVIAIGFDDLRERVDAQVTQAAGHQEKLKEIQSLLQALQNKHSTSTVPKLARFASDQAQLTLRLLQFIQHLHLLIPAVRSSSIRPEEEELRKKLEDMQEVVRGGGGRMRAKLGELWAVLGAIKSRDGGRAAPTRSGEWKVVDEDGLAKITQVLADQQAGLKHLTKILQKALKDVAIITGTRPPGSGEDLIDAGTLFSSSSSSYR